MDDSSERQFRDQIYEHLAEMCKGFANPRRLEMIEFLAQSEHSVEELARKTNISVASASQHLQQLRAARLVSVRRIGVKANYRLAEEEVLRTLRAIYVLGSSRLAEIERLVHDFLPARETLQAVSDEELCTAIQSDEPIILDVRPRQEYLAGHIRGAFSIPRVELSQRLEELPRAKEIIVYCRSRYSTLSDQAVTELRALGYDARRLRTGYLEWKSCGLPSEHDLDDKTFAELSKFQASDAFPESEK